MRHRLALWMFNTALWLSPAIELAIYELAAQRTLSAQLAAHQQRVAEIACSN